MWKDHIVEEVRKVREKHAAKLNFNIKAIVEDAKKRQCTSKHRVVSFIPEKHKASYRDRTAPHGATLPHHQAYGSVLGDSADQAESDPGEHKPK